VRKLVQLHVTNSSRSDFTGQIPRRNSEQISPLA
jgi:hypothetical protein